MIRHSFHRGPMSALVTPFRSGRIDYESFGNMIDRQIESGIRALVFLGTTGEASTLSDYERRRAYRFVTERVSGRAKVILGTGSLDTRRAMICTREAEVVGADAALVVTPYYNKGTEDGIREHYKRIANTVDLPIILYNVPSRTGVNLSLRTINELSEEANIIGIKEASDSVDRQMSLYAMKERLAVYSGNDTEIYLNLALGGSGTVSVLSSLLPKEVLRIYELWDSGRGDEALSLQLSLLPLIKALFLETNPAPLKYALSLLGLCSDEVRMPMGKLTDATKRAIEEALEPYSS